MTRSLFYALNAARTVATITVIAASLAACGGDDDDTVSEASRATEPMPTPNGQMQAVLDQLTALGAKPIESLTVAAARTQPGPSDAVKAILTAQGKSTAPEAVGSVVDRTITGSVGPLAVRVYTPAGTGPFPVVMYIHGGGWVIATIDTYDSSARAIANAANAIVVSTEYSHAPEFKFPTAHNDTYAAWKWTLANAASLNGLPTKVAIAGESAGGNMAASIALRAKADGVQMPVHQVLVYPVTNYAFNSPSQQQNANAKPLGTATLAWFYEKYLPTPADGANPLFSVLQAPSLAGLPSATVITADIDPLRSEGRAYADKLQAAGVSTHWQNFEGVTHEFFGLGAVVDQSKAAVALAGTELKAAFAR